MKQNEQKYFTPFCKSSTTRNCQSVQLRNIMHDVKHLQKCIQKIKIFQPEQSRVNLSNNHKTRTHSRQSHKSITNSCKSSKTKQNSVRTFRKEHIQSKNDSLMLKLNTEECKPYNQSKTINCIKKQNSTTGREQIIFGFPSDYISLRVENLKLQKQNLILENKLLQQQLLMQRRQKELLKNRLKRIKTFNSSKREDKKLQSDQKQKPNTKYPKVNAFDCSPINPKIPIIPEYSMKTKLESKENQNIKKNMAGEHLNCNDLKHQEQLMDSLLLSESNRSQRKQHKNIFSKEGWQFVDKNHRSTLSDIANKENLSNKKY